MVARKFCTPSFRAKSSSFTKKFHKFSNLGLLSPQLLVLAWGGPKFIQPTLASSHLLFISKRFIQKEFCFLKKRIFLKREFLKKENQ